MATSRSSRVLIGFLEALRDSRAVSGLNWGGLAYIHPLYEMKNASRTSPESKASVAALWSVLEIWMYEHFPTLASARTRVAAYPYAASWVGAVRRRVSLATFRIALQVLHVEEVVWRPFVGAPIPVSAMLAHFFSGRRVLLPGVYRHMWYLGERVSLQHSTRDRLVPKDPPETMLARIEDVARLYLDAGGDAVCIPWENFVDRKGSHEGLLARLAPPVRFVLSEEEVDPEDVPYADRVVRYVDSDGEQVGVAVPIASPPHRRSYDAVPEHYAAAPRARVRRCMLVIDSLKRQCANMTKKLTGRDREERRRGPRDSVEREPQVETLVG
ncbi:uncharacterized protein [Spinacia oleracea]|uniref:Aminotransferase-like plant mobile domain-containing protein n=1 Tax=Spinacia oleracea TaxID=3562 RepID=A0ABM3RVZ3_SPIOL|nr:uncharacterized protein LOC110778742 [Spinacia oleracea]XP_056699778.1 uncharacterized protein LOC110778742 [Spinacia oleracea]XP_056699779.1 uncharacterized protein LOC110778742 [Spinacia oleracea]XP_056699780.1 uncharacterized protein LOC110778742 [Spinacia oleracea]XP_056699781.1 uncharacterized protein LOC110778742 [Spinacia oleracea]XP_056699782.1 uncharacterized protein LOC110778742 [Spinacia oleracea]XP_056699783.1 uncharacterized protein LOC110778742 [Spinacia oleracea]XP_05669978